MTHRVLYQYMYTICDRLVIQCPAVMLSPRGQSGPEAKILASASKIWPQSGLDLVVLLCNRAKIV